MASKKAILKRNRELFERLEQEDAAYTGSRGWTLSGINSGEIYDSSKTWRGWGGHCIGGCNACRVTEKTVEFCRQNNLPIGSCFDCLKACLCNDKPVVNPIFVAFPWGCRY